MRARDQRNKLARSLAIVWRLAMSPAEGFGSPIGEPDPMGLLSAIAGEAQSCFQELRVFEEVKEHADRLFCKGVKAG